MKFNFGSWDNLSAATSTALTFGNFDGVHRGHQLILQTLRREADARGLPVAVLLFEPQPAEFFKVNPLVRITSLRDKLKALSAYGVDQVYCLRFNQAVATRTSDFFVSDLLLKRLQAAFILIGEDANFGSGRSGSAASLSQVTQAAGKAVQVISNYEEQGARISSTWVRQALSQGDFIQAAYLLGRPYSVTGTVKYGAGIGRQLGVPTANLHVHYRRPPIGGVFVVEIIEPDGQVSEGLANWGKRQTVCGEKLVLEVHGLQLEGSLYGQELEVRFLKKLRDERKFSSLNLLLEQIHRDIAQARDYFVRMRVV